MKPELKKSLLVCFAVLIASEAFGFVRVIQKRMSVGYVCVEGRYVFDHNTYDANGHITGCSYLWQPDLVQQVSDPAYDCGPNGGGHYWVATKGWNAFRGICYGALTVKTDSGTSAHLETTFTP